jgi:predicted lipoprotein
MKKPLDLNRLKNLLIAFVTCCFLVACTDDQKGGDKVNFDRAAMLVHWYDNLMLPAFGEFAQHTEALKQAFAAFETTPNAAQLENLRTEFEKAYQSFQYIKSFEIGPSASLSLRANLNTYPADTHKIEQMVANGSFSGGAANQLDAQAFPALDYLLFSANVDLLSSTEHRSYVAVNIQFLHNLAQSAATQWTNYRTTFVNAKGNDVGSSLGQIVNALNQDYELIKNAKIGFPAGKKTFGTPYPKACEGYYAQNSIVLASENLRAIHQFYKGISALNSSVGSSLYDNLLALNTKAEGMLLADLLDIQFEDAIQKLNAITTPFSEAVVNDKATVDAAYSAIQLNIIYLKTDLPSALGVVITYQDNDGD